MSPLPTNQQQPAPQRAAAHFARRGDSQPTQAMPAPQPAGAGATTLLKRYRPLETRAAGGFGSVEICLDARLQRRVAIKRMPLTAAAGSPLHETTATALAEARTASLLQHPNIVAVIDFTYDEAYAYLVMEYVDGMSLEEFLAGVEGHSLTFDEVAAVADALGQALSYAHENGVLHLDIKPANVLIDRSGHVKLTDFGMAALASSAGFGGARGGTIGYMPPEQLRGEEVDERADVFSLAAVLYECLCASAPFRAATPTESLKRIERGVMPPGELLPDLPERAEDALLQALSPAPHDRMSSVRLFSERFLKRLGNPREGRKSLARIIARLASDDPDATVQQAPAAAASPERTWELDPAEGHLGSRTPRARAWAVGIICGLSCAYALWYLLDLLQVEGVLTRTVLTLATGAAAALAPQLGSALVLAGFLTLALGGQSFVTSLPVGIALAAIGAAWWYSWGRKPAASAMFCALVALGARTSSPLSGALVIAAVAGYFLEADAAAATTALGIVATQLLLNATAAEGLPVGTALSALASPAFWLQTLVATLTAGLTSLALQRTWERYRSGRGSGFAALAGAIPFAAGILVCIALNAFGSALDLGTATSLDAMEIAGIVGAGLLASIMVAICVYTLGYRKTPEDGD